MNKTEKITHKIKYVDLLKIIEEMYRKVGYNHSAGFDDLEHEVLTSYSQEEIDLSKFLKEGLY